MFAIYLLSPRRCSLVSNNACPRCTPAGACLSCEVCKSPLRRGCVHHESRAYQGWEDWWVMEQARNPAACGSVLCPGMTAVEWMGSFHSEMELSCHPKTCMICRWYRKSCKITYMFFSFSPLASSESLQTANTKEESCAKLLLPLKMICKVLQSKYLSETQKHYNLMVEISLRSQ